MLKEMVGKFALKEAKIPTLGERKQRTENTGKTEYIELGNGDFGKY
jgi:hypothetical protein